MAALRFTRLDLVDGLLAGDAAYRCELCPHTLMGDARRVALTAPGHAGRHGLDEYELVELGDAYDPELTLAAFAFAVELAGAASFGRLF